MKSLARERRYACPPAIFCALVLSACVSWHDQMSSTENNSYCYANLDGWGVHWHESEDGALCLDANDRCEHAMAGAPRSACAEHNRLRYNANAATRLALDTWYRVPPYAATSGESLRDGAARFVARSDLDADLRLLDRQAAAPLVGKNYLLRAVVCDHYREGVEIRRMAPGRYLVVTIGYRMGSEGPSVPNQTERDVVVARLPEVPVDLYAECSVRGDL